LSKDYAAYVMPDFPRRIVGEDLDRILKFGFDQGGFDDMYFAPEDPVMVRVDDRLVKLSERALEVTEVEEVINRVYGANGVIQAGKDGFLNHGYTSRRDGWEGRYRFNCIQVRGRYRETQYQCTLRSIPQTPMTVDKVGLDRELLGAMCAYQGLVLVTGPTGSGKSTLLAAVVRHLLEDGDKDRVIITYEEPIEYTYDRIVARTGKIWQTEIPRHVASFAAGVREALRRHPDVILVGELRDTETILSAIELAGTGHLVLATTHSNGVSETIRRLVTKFDGPERTSRLAELIDSLRVIVTQRMEANPKGGRTPLREQMIFTPELRKELLRMQDAAQIDRIDGLLRERGHKLLQDAERRYAAGEISETAILRYRMSD
jgi:defect in organelle trafficking protein DotB